MADKPFFPGFEGDDEPKAPAKPAAPAVPAAKKSAFDPFADAPVKVPAPGAAQPSPAAPAPAPGRPVAPAPGKPAAPAPAPPPPPALPGNDDADIKPGARKDLWNCPHCGAGNKPDRDTCRACGKSPHDEVIIPLWKKPLFRAGILAAIGLVVVVVVMAGRTDLSFHEPSLATIDKKPRIGGSASGSVELPGGAKFDGERLISVVGRVAAVGRGPSGTTTIALALGAAARDEQPTATPAANGGFDIPGGVVLACTSETPLTVKPGQIISLAGVSGTLIKDAAIMREAEGMIAVQVQQVKAAE